MKIVYFTDTFLPNINGVVTSILNSSRILAKKGHEIYIFTTKPKRKNFEMPILEKNIKIYYFPQLKLLNYPDFQLTFPRLIKMYHQLVKINPDVIHIHIPSPFGYSALILSKKLKKPVIGTYHTFLPDFLKYFPIPGFEKLKIAKKLTWAYTRKFYNKCDVVTTPSIAMKKELENNGVKKTVMFLSNGVDLKKFHPIKNEKNGKTFLHVGRISYEKNIDILIKAFNLLIKKEHSYRLLIAGKGPAQENLEKLVNDLGIQDNVKFLGPIKYDNLPELYSSSDVFVTASTVETEGLVILEAMASGLPIIGVNKLAVPYVVKDKKNGFVIKPFDEHEFYLAMEKLIKDSSLRKKFGEESLKLVNEYSLVETTKKLEKIYESLL